MSEPTVNYRRRYLTPEQKVQIVTDYNAEMPIPQILERHGISRPTLYRVLKTVVQKEEQNGE